MPNLKANSAAKNSIRREKLKEKSSSFNGRTATMMGVRELRRPNTLPNLMSHETAARPQQLTKLLLNVTVQGSVGALHVLTTSDSIVGDLILLAVGQYTKEGRRPILPSTDPARFDLHYSQFSLDSLDRDEKLINLGSRNFFLCQRRVDDEAETASSHSVSCSEQVEKAAKTSLPWLKIMNFLL
uniref:DUF7054 domain-containing protein n=1 Tax=Kalanchoe fedtschenkoi TaxID=63787 RepID=A0A7N0ZZ04_KALFE